MEHVGGGDTNTNVDISHAIANQFKDPGSGECDEHTGTGIAMISDSAALVAAVDLVEASTVDTMILDKLAPNVNGSNSLILELKKKKKQEVEETK